MPTGILITYATRHGATRDIATALGVALGQARDGDAVGLAVSVAPVDERPDPYCFDAVILGSPVSSGRWLAPARLYSTAFAGGLCTRPTWLFSTGTFEHAEPDDATTIREHVGARGHRWLPSDRRLVESWAGEIARELGPARSPAAAD